MITTLPFPEQLTQIERFFWQLELTSRPQSLGCNIFEITLSRTTRQTLPVCSLSSSLTASSATTQTVAALTAGLKPDCFVSVRIPRSPAEINVSGSKRSIRIPFTWFQMLFCYWSFHQLNPVFLHFLSASSFPLTFLLFFFPAPPLLPILKSLPCIDFLPPLFSSGIFLSSLWESILLNSCHTERFCSLSGGSGETLCQTERKKGEAESLQGCWLEVVHFPLSSIASLPIDREFDLSMFRNEKA